MVESYTKQHAVNTIHERMHSNGSKISKASIMEVHDELFTFIKEDIIMKDRSYNVKGFGTFLRTIFKATRKHNPQTKKIMNVPARKAAKITFSLQFTKELNSK